MMITFAERLREQRELHHLTQSQLAKEMDVTRSSVNAWEMGISLPTVAKLVQLAVRFSVSTDYLLGLTRENTVSLHQLTYQEREIIGSLLEYFQQARQKQREKPESGQQS